MPKKRHHPRSVQPGPAAAPQTAAPASEATRPALVLPRRVAVRHVQPEVVIGVAEPDVAEAEFEAPVAEPLEVDETVSPEEPAAVVPEPAQKRGLFARLRPERSSSTRPAAAAEPISVEEEDVEPEPVVAVQPAVHEHITDFEEFTDVDEPGLLAPYAVATDESWSSVQPVRAEPEPSAGPWLEEQSQAPDVTAPIDLPVATPSWGVDSAATEPFEFVPLIPSLAEPVAPPADVVVTPSMGWRDWAEEFEAPAPEREPGLSAAAQAAEADWLASRDEPATVPPEVSGTVAPGPEPAAGSAVVGPLTAEDWWPAEPEPDTGWSSLRLEEDWRPDDRSSAVAPATWNWVDSVADEAFAEPEAVPARPARTHAKRHGAERGATAKAKRPREATAKAKRPREAAKRPPDKGKPRWPLFVTPLAVLAAVFVTIALGARIGTALLWDAVIPGESAVTVPAEYSYVPAEWPTFGVEPALAATAPPLPSSNATVSAGATATAAAPSVDPVTAAALPYPDPPSVQPVVISRLKPKHRYVAITLDDGIPFDTRLMDLFERHNARATTFVLGQFASTRPELVDRLNEHGFEIANHSWDHRDLTKLSDAELRKELSKTQSAISEVTGNQAPYMRPPGGKYNEKVKTVAASMGYRVVMWNRSLADTSPSATPDQLYHNAVDGLQPGDIILCHWGRPDTYAAMAKILPELERRGFRAVTVSELIADSGGVGSLQ